MGNYSLGVDFDRWNQQKAGGMGTWNQFNEYKNILSADKLKGSAADENRMSLTSFLDQMQGRQQGFQERMVDKAISTADPFANQRGQYQVQLANLIKNPGDVASSPMYKFAMDQGLEAANRGLAQKGMLNSGNRALELQSVGQGIAGQNFFKMADLLASLAGRDSSSPGAAASVMNSIMNQSNPLDWAKLYEQGRQANMSAGKNTVNGQTVSLNAGWY